MSSLIFNGNGYTISNLFINRPSQIYIGLFGGKGTSTITNVGLINVNITGNYQVGGLIAHTGGIVSNSFVTGSVTGNNIVVGGLVGLSAGKIINSYSTATVNGNGNSWVGGLVGCNWGTDARVLNSYSTGAGVFVFACERLVFDGPRETVEPTAYFHRVSHTFAVDGADFLYDARAEITGLR